MLVAPTHSQPLRVLHLFANYKWTGPADPAIRAAAWQRRIGHDVRFGIAGYMHPRGEHRMAEELWHAGMPVVTGLQLRKHFKPAALLRDVRALRRILQRDRYDVVHTHLLGDHLTAALALGRQRPGRPLLMRSCYDPAPPRRDWRAALAFARTDGVLLPTPGVVEPFQRRFRGPRVRYQEPTVEPTRPQRTADPSASGPVAAPFAQDVSDSNWLVGITARIQPHRRFELLWEVVAEVTARHDHVRFVLLGRGNERDTEQLVREPVRRLGLQRHVLLPGYLKEPHYSAALRRLDAFLFLVPGSDGTCRAVREVLPLGVPVVATDRGILPHLVGAWDGPEELPGKAPVGLVCEESAAALAAALTRIHDDPALRSRFSAAARARAFDAMDAERAARGSAAFYAELRG